MIVGSGMDPSGRGAFASVNILVKWIRDYIGSWNGYAKTFTWTGIAEEILAEDRAVQTSMKKIVNNNSKQCNPDRGTPVRFRPDLYRVLPLRLAVTGWNALA
ncbi:hypothetical protein [Streptomyces sp. 2-1]|uniref:hypothetical protein n=1 Tax=Streptomyces sp. 2-1 TaxID=412710 RepID=UPI003AFAFA64